MSSLTFRVLLRQFHKARELPSGLLKFSPAAAHYGHHTCRTTQDVRLTGSLRSLASPVFPPQIANTRLYHSSSSKKSPSPKSAVAELDEGPDFVPSLCESGQEITDDINASVQSGDIGRLFAVVHVGSHQRKVTTEDLVMIEGPFPAYPGDRIRLEKVLMVGGKDFTLTGTPILRRDLVRVEATVIEKAMSHVRFKFDYIRRKRFMKFKLKQFPYTTLVINSIEVNPAALKK